MLYYFKKGKTATETHEKICAVYGGKSFLLKIRNKKGYLLSLLFNIVLEVLAIVIGQEKNKMHSNWKRSETVIICRQHDSVHRKPYNLHQKKNT